VGADTLGAARPSSERAGTAHCCGRSMSRRRSAHERARRSRRSTAHAPSPKDRHCRSGRASPAFAATLSPRKPKLAVVELQADPPDDRGSEPLQNRCRLPGRSSRWLAPIGFETIEQILGNHPGRVQKEKQLGIEGSDRSDRFGRGRLAKAMAIGLNVSAPIARMPSTSSTARAIVLRPARIVTRRWDRVG